MDWRLLSPLRSVLNLVRGERTRHQLALGLALGLVIGLLPKGNLTAVLFATLLLATRVNTGMGLLTAFCTSWLSPGLDPWCDAIGRGILTNEGWQNQFATWYQLPMVPWFGLHNTVVLGSLILGCAAILPAYYLSQPLFVYCKLDKDCQRPSEESVS